MSQRRVRIYVLPDRGDDRSPGTRERPLRTLRHALRVARELEATTEDLRADVYVKSGPYWVHARMLPLARELLDPEPIR